MILFIWVKRVFERDAFRTRFCSILTSRGGQFVRQLVVDEFRILEEDNDNTKTGIAYSRFAETLFQIYSKYVSLITLLAPFKRTLKKKRISSRENRGETRSNTWIENLFCEESKGGGVESFVEGTKKNEKEKEKRGVFLECFQCTLQKN